MSPRRLLAIVLVAVTTACAPSTEPASVSLDVQGASADYRALQEMLASEGIAGVQSLAGRTPMSAGAAVAAMRVLPRLGDGAGGRAYVLELLGAARAQRAEVAAWSGRRVISPTHLGRTFVYDASRDTYVVDASRTGAPANGVRFIVHEVDDRGKPIPSKEIGRADLIDEGATSDEVIALRLLVVTRGVTALDYRTRVDLSATSGSIDVVGFAAEGSERLEFTIGVDARGAGGTATLDADFELAVKPRNFTVTGTVRGVTEGVEGIGSVTLVARHQQNTLRVELRGTSATLDGRITWNGSPWVTISGPAASPVLRGPTGQPLTAEELLAVRGVMRLSDDVFDLVEELVEPVEDLVLLGWLL